jgi:hypothetical protein
MARAMSGHAMDCCARAAAGVNTSMTRAVVTTRIVDRRMAVEYRVFLHTMSSDLRPAFRNLGRGVF